MVLVPEENLLQMGTQSHRQSTFGTDTPQAQVDQAVAATLSRLDIEMNEILNSNKYKDEREKWAAYLIVLQRYLHFADSDRTQQYLSLMKNKEAESGNNEKKKDESNCNRMNDSIIIESIPAKFRTKAKLLLRRLHDAPASTFSWNSAGVVSLGGKAIKDSNIVDLVNDAMRARKVAKPAGRRAFAKFLRTIQAPREFIGNDELWLESRANSTLQQQTEDNGGSSSAELSEIDHNEFYSGSENNSNSRTHSRDRGGDQRGSGCKNKKRRVTWANLKLK